MDYQQLLHLACALEHYGEHQEMANDNGTVFTLADFLMDHYLDPANDVHDTGNKHEHPCQHSHNHTIDYAEIGLFAKALIIAPSNVKTQRFNTISLLYSADFTSGLEEPPSA